MVCRLGDVATRRAAYAAVPEVCRTPTMLFEFIDLHKAMSPDSNGWGRCLRRAVTKVYSKPAYDVAYAVTKYGQRNGWTHRDLLRLTHVKPKSTAHELVFHYAVKGEVMSVTAAADDKVYADDIKVHNFLHAVEDAKKCDNEHAMVALITDHRLAREHINTRMLNSVCVWGAMLPNMPFTALIRNLGKMTSVGLLAPLSDAASTVVSKLKDADGLKRARVHPFTLLVALLTYRRGHGEKGSLTWMPNFQVEAALEEAFYLSFGTVTPTGKRYVLGLDVSGSMDCGYVDGSCVTPREAAAAMAMVTMRTEPQCHPMGFSRSLVPVPISASDNLATVIKKMKKIPMGGTDCALPMLWAAEKRINVDVFIIYTDCETWCGKVTPVDALRAYRSKMKIDAKLVVVAMTSGGFTIAHPEDGGMLDVVGFDTAAPAVIQGFVMGNV